MIYVCIPTTKERRQRLEACISAIQQSRTTEPFTICVYENSEGGWVRAFRRMLEGIDGLVFNVNVDVIIHPDCLDTLARKYREYFPDEDGAVQPYDQMQEGTAACYAFAHSRVFKEYLHDGYIHYFADIEMRERLAAIGKFRYVPQALTSHFNVEFDRSLDDETYRTARGHAQHDARVYNERKRGLQLI